MRYLIRESRRSAVCPTACACVVEEAPGVALDASLAASALPDEIE